MSEEKQYKLKKKFFETKCPACGGLAEGKVDLGDEPRYWCGVCGENWTPSQIDECVECGKPLGGSDAICHSCFADETEQRDDGGNGT